MADAGATAVITHLFSDIEGSTRLWEREPVRMNAAVARHDAIAQHAVQAHRGRVVKMLGDGLHAVFDDAADAVAAVLQLQFALAAPADDGIELRARCGLHLGADDRRDGDFYGQAVNRAARIANAAHGGQVLLSRAVADAVAARLPQEASLRELGAVRLRDLARAEQVFQLEHPKLRSSFPALRSLEAVPNNLPQQLDSFVGRVQELAEARALLAEHRMLTFVGIGGLGKSRLSLQLGAAVLDDFPDGVWLVELAALADPALVAQAAASVLGVREQAGQPVQDALAAFVRDRRLLLILDNCEHLVAACAELAQRLLRAGPHLKIVASSREALRFAGEQTYPVPTLSVPGADAAGRASPEALERHDAVQLFIDRARAARPAFRVDASNASAVAEVCHRLDGIPLAIELAAARLRALSVIAIRDRLNDRFRLLVVGDRTVLPRQQTLRALIDWSHELLDDAERTLFRRLSVFAGGWTLDAAEAVCAGDGLHADRIVDLLGQLVEKSLVAMAADGSRYRMLDTVRAYARQQLAAAGEDDVARRRHVAFFLDLAEAAAPQLFGPQQGEWLQRLDADQENLRATQPCFAIDEACARQGLRLVFALRAYWINRGLLTLGHRVTVETLALEAARTRDGHRSRALHAAGQLSFFTGRYAEAQRELEESLAIAKERQDEDGHAAVLGLLGVACLNQGNLPQAQAYAEEAVSLARRRDNKRQLTSATTTLGHLHRLQGRPQEAWQLYADALGLARLLQDKQSIALALLNLALATVELGTPSAAAPMLHEAIEVGQAIGSITVGQCALEVGAGVAAAQGEWSRAARFFGAAEAQAERSGSQRDAVDDAFLMPWMQRAEERLGPEPWAACQRQGRSLSLAEGLGELAAWLRPAAPASPH